MNKLNKKELNYVIVMLAQSYLTFELNNVNINLRNFGFLVFLGMKNDLMSIEEQNRAKMVASQQKHLINCSANYFNQKDHSGNWNRLLNLNQSIWNQHQRLKVSFFIIFYQQKNVQFISTNDWMRLCRFVCVNVCFSCMTCVFLCFLVFKLHKEVYMFIYSKLMLFSIISKFLWQCIFLMYLVVTYI